MSWCVIDEEKTMWKNKRLLQNVYHSMYTHSAFNSTLNFQFRCYFCFWMRTMLIVYCSAKSRMSSFAGVFQRFIFDINCGAQIWSHLFHFFLLWTACCSLVVVMVCALCTTKSEERTDMSGMGLGSEVDCAGWVIKAQI